jgi:PAS domain S-box-containing protein
MSNIPNQPSAHATLRQTAESRLDSGSAPATYGSAIGASSLTLLHRLASDPETASDALKLLHELQVHQVELDLQYEHMNEEFHALAQSVHQLTELFVLAPVAYFMVSPSGVIAEGNLVGARMLGVERDDVGSQNIGRLATPDSRASMLALLEQVLSSGLRHSCRVQALDTTRQRWLEVIASASPDAQHCLVVVVEASDLASASLQA